MSKIAVLLLFFTLLILLQTQSVFAPPSYNPDWPSAPYCPGGCPLDYLKQEWSKYYDMKGKDWMESKKQEMMQSIESGSLNQWADDPTWENINVRTYYYMMGEIPDQEGKYIDEVFAQMEQERVEQLIDQGYLPIGDYVLALNAVIPIALVAGVGVMVWFLNRRKKMKKIFLYYIAIAVSLFVFAGFLTGFLPNTSALLVSADPMGEMDVVVVGKIISATPNYDDVETEYVAEIEEIVKGWDLLESGNQTKSIRFSSPGILGYEDESYHHVYDKIFQTGDRALLMLNQRNGVLHESLWSRITTSDCRGDEIAQLHYAPGGLHLSQGGSDESPFYTNEPITAKFYYFNKELSNKTVNIEFVVVDDFPDVYHSENVTLSLKRCQPYAEASTEFIMSEPSTFAIRAIAGDNEGGSQSFSGVKVIDYVLSPLNQLTSGIPINEIQCREEMILITKLSDGSPACVRSETKQKLIERGWAENRPVSFRAPPGSLRVPQEVISITINDNDMPVIPIKRGETREIGVLVAPKIPIILSSVYIESYFGSACDSQNSTAYCPGKNITMKLSDESLTSQKEITLTVIVPNNMTVGQYGYKIVAKTTFDSPYYDDPLTVENSTRFDLLVQRKQNTHAKNAKMGFSDENRLKRHYEKAHPKKSKFIDPKDYWHDAGAGI